MDFNPWKPLYIRPHCQLLMPFNGNHRFIGLAVRVRGSWTSVTHLILFARFAHWLNFLITSTSVRSAQESFCGTHKRRYIIYILLSQMYVHFSLFLTLTCRQTQTIYETIYCYYSYYSWSQTTAWLLYCKLCLTKFLNSFIAENQIERYGEKVFSLRTCLRWLPAFITWRV